ncbi:MAG: hypothetical protein LC793_16150 [Thermomicrobia bacterium]|nr:hypothetical protein [Thermomicrobia bacterium]MCA1723238.1 hypothetical protein [Thermomicrobia bacterium]
MFDALVSLAAWEANITVELPLMFGMVVIGIALIWLIQKLTGGFDKRGD